MQPLYYAMKPIADADPIGCNHYTAKQVKGTEKIILPGNVQAWHEATIYARTNGYIKKWYVDIGSHVKKGDLLAVIETPELDAQLRQAKADLNTAIANNQFSTIHCKTLDQFIKNRFCFQAGN